MSNFYERKSVPMWRIVCYGFLATAGVAAVGFYQNDRFLLGAAVFCGVTIGLLGFFWNWMRINVAPIAVANKQSKRIPRFVVLLFVVGILVSTALKLWDIFHKN